MDAHGHGLAIEGLVAVDERGVLLAVDRVPEPDGVEVAEPCRQLGDGGDADAHVVAAVAGAVVGGVAVEEGVKCGQGHGSPVGSVSRGTPPGWRRMLRQVRGWSSAAARRPRRG